MTSDRPHLLNSAGDFRRRRQPAAEIELIPRLADLIGVPVERLRPESVLSDIVHESFRLVEVAIDLQEEYDVIFTQDDLRRVSTVADLDALIVERRRRR